MKDGGVVCQFLQAHIEHGSPFPRGEPMPRPAHCSRDTVPDPRSLPAVVDARGALIRLRPAGARRRSARPRGADGSRPRRESGCRVPPPS
ncbi:hypothetical protein ACFPRL_07805 [Pseudoclavibacter helvolus]